MTILRWLTARQKKSGSNHGRRHRLRFEPLERRELLAGWVANSVNLGGGSDPGLDITLDAAGNAYVTGNFEGTMAFGNTTLTSNGSMDVFVAKIDPQGQFLWATSAGGASRDTGWSIAVDAAGNAYVTGYFSGQANFGGITQQSRGGLDGFVAKLNVDTGNFEWVKRVGGDTHSEGHAIAVAPDGSVVVMGEIHGEGDFDGILISNSGEEDRFLAQLDSNGLVIWTQRRGGPNYDPGRGLAVDSQSNVFITWADDAGQPVLSKLNLAGDIIWDHPILLGGEYFPWEGTMAISEDVNGTTIYVGSQAGVSKIVDFGDAASLAWRKDHMPTAHVATDALGNVYGTGTWDGGRNDFDPGSGYASLPLQSFIWKLDGNGDFVALRQGPANGDYEGSYGITLDGAGNIYTTGSFGGTDLEFDIGTALVAPALPPSGQAMYVLKTTQEMGGLFGQVFNDLDNDGVWDFTDANSNGVWETNELGEPSLTGATVYLDADEDGQLDAGEQTATVERGGDYRFSHVAPGTHSVRLLKPTGWNQSLPADGGARSVVIAAGTFETDVDFAAHVPAQTRTYTSVDVPKKYPSRYWQETESKLTITDSYPIFGIDVSVSVTSNRVTLTLIAPDGTSVGIQPGTVHLNDFNYKDVKGTWILRIKKYDPDPSGSVTGWSMKVLGQANSLPPAGITVTPTSGLVTTESGASASFSVVLNAQPMTNVTIPISSNDTTEGTLVIASLIFTPTNWNTAQTVTVTGVDDSERDGNIAYTIVLAPATSTDSRYNGLDPANVAVTNQDNEAKGKPRSTSTSATSSESAADFDAALALYLADEENVTGRRRK